MPYPTQLKVFDIVDSWNMAALGEPTMRPSLRGRFDGHEEVLLYDTGSAITRMSEAAYQRMTKKDITGKEKFASASGNEIVATEKVRVCFQLIGNQILYDVFVVKGLHENFILGIDFIRAYNLNYCPRQFFWEGGCPRHEIERTSIPGPVIGQSM